MIVPRPTRATDIGVTAVVAALAALLVAAVVAPTSSRLVNSLATPPAFVDPGTASVTASDGTSPVVVKRRRPVAAPVPSLTVPLGVSRPEVLQVRAAPSSVEPVVAPAAETAAEVAPAPLPTFDVPAAAPAPVVVAPAPTPTTVRTKPGKAGTASGGAKSNGKTDDNAVFDLTIAGAAVDKHEKKDVDHSDELGETKSESKPDRKPKQAQK